MNRNNAQNEKGGKENTKTESAIIEVAVVKVNETFITDKCTARKSKRRRLHKQ